MFWDSSFWRRAHTQSDGREPSGSFQRGVVDARLDLARAAPVNENKSTAAQWTVALYIYRLGALLVVTKAEGAARLAIFLRQARTSHAPSLERGAQSSLSRCSIGRSISTRQSRRKKCPTFRFGIFGPINSIASFSGKVLSTYLFKLLWILGSGDRNLMLLYIRTAAVGIW